MNKCTRKISMIWLTTSCSRMEHNRMWRNPKRKSLRRTKTAPVGKESQVAKLGVLVTLQMQIIQNLPPTEANHQYRVKLRRAKRWNLSNRSPSELNLCPSPHFKKQTSKLRQRKRLNNLMSSLSPRWAPFLRNWRITATKRWESMQKSFVLTTIKLGSSVFSPNSVWLKRNVRETAALAPLLQRQVSPEDKRWCRRDRPFISQVLFTNKHSVLCKSADSFQACWPCEFQTRAKSVSRNQLNILNAPTNGTRFHRRFNGLIYKFIQMLLQPIVEVC